MPHTTTNILFIITSSLSSPPSTTQARTTTSHHRHHHHRCHHDKGALVHCTTTTREEEERLAREKAQQVEEANIAWDDVQAKIEADYKLAQRMQAQEQEELTDEEKARLFVQFLEQRRKHFAAKRAEEKRNIPPTAGEELEQESSKKQKLEEDKEFEELKKYLEIVLDDGDDVTIDATPLSTRSPTIIDYKIYKEGKKSYFQIIRADGNSQMHLTFGKMVKNFNKEDLEVLWSIVKARFMKTEPVNYMDNFLLLNLKTMFEHHVEDNVWKNQHGLVKELNWKLYDSCGVHCLIMGVKWHLSFLDWSRNSLRKDMYLNEVFGSILLVIDEALDET
ncbi:hypothetical protein Tco_0012097 [Tanacetum coccineum]